MDSGAHCNFNTCLVQDESFRLDAMNCNSISLNWVAHNQTCQYVCLEDDNCNASSFKDSKFGYLMSCSGHVANLKEFKRIWSVFSEGLSYVVEKIPTYMPYNPSTSFYFKEWKAKQTFYAASICNPPCKGNTDEYYGIQYGLKKEYDAHDDAVSINHDMVWCRHISIGWQNN